MVVSGTDILVDGRKVADVAEVMAAEDDVIAPLKAELELLAKRQVIREENKAQGRPSRSWATRTSRTACCAR